MKEFIRGSRIEITGTRTAWYRLMRVVLPRGTIPLERKTEIFRTHALRIKPRELSVEKSDTSRFIYERSWTAIWATRHQHRWDKTSLRAAQLSPPRKDPLCGGRKLGCTQVRWNPTIYTFAFLCQRAEKRRNTNNKIAKTCKKTDFNTLVRFLPQDR